MDFPRPELRAILIPVSGITVLCFIPVGALTFTDCFFGRFPVISGPMNDDFFRSKRLVDSGSQSNSMLAAQ